MRRQDLDRETGAHPLLALAQEEARDRRYVRWAVAAAMVFHAFLFVVRLPEVTAAPEPPKPTPTEFPLQSFTPPPPPQPDLVPKPHRVRIPVPDPTPDEPEPVRLPEVEEPLPEPNEDAVIGDIAPPPPPEPEEGPLVPSGELREPRRIVFVEPVYPEIARKVGVEDTVILQLVVAKDGSVKDIRVLRPGRMGLTEAALEAVRQWRYEPSTLNGRPVEVLLSVTVRFQLHR
ncbi:MAG: energy transducer TonB [Thermoanaerobaculum sp.]